MMGSQDFLGRRDTGEILVSTAFLAPLARMESGEMMGRLGLGGCLESRDLEVSLALKAHLVFLDPRASEAWMVPMVPKGAWDPKGSQDLPDSRELLGPRASLGLRVPSALMERRVLWGNQGSPACLAQTDSRVTPGRKVPQEPKETRVHLDLRALLGTPDPEVSRVWTEFGV